MAATARETTEPAFSLGSTRTRRTSATGCTASPRASCRPAARRVGRARGDALADHPGGGEDRPLRLRGARPVLGRPDRPDAADRQRGAVLGRRRHRHVDHGHVAGGRRDLRPGHAASRSASGSRAASAAPTSPRSRRSASPSPTRAPTSPPSARRPATTRPPASGCSTARRRGRPTAASPASTSSSPPSTARSARAATPRSSSRRARKGLEQGAKVKKHGLRASHTADVYLDDCRVPGTLPARRQGQARRAPGPRP